MNEDLGKREKDFPSSSKTLGQRLKKKTVIWLAQGQEELGTLHTIPRIMAEQN